MSKETLIRKLTSRKLWLAIALFVSVTLILIDSDGTIIENKKIPTAYEPAE